MHTKIIVHEKQSAYNNYKTRALMNLLAKPVKLLLESDLTEDCGSNGLNTTQVSNTLLS